MVQGLSKWEERQEYYMLLSDYRVDLGLLLTASPSLANVDLQLLLSIHSERPAWQKYCIAGATWVLRL